MQKQYIFLFLIHIGSSKESYSCVNYGPIAKAITYGDEREGAALIYRMRPTKENPSQSLGLVILTEKYSFFSDAKLHSLQKNDPDNDLIKTLILHTKAYDAQKKIRPRKRCHEEVFKIIPNRVDAFLERWDMETSSLKLPIDPEVDALLAERHLSFSKEKVHKPFRQ